MNIFSKFVYRKDNCQQLGFCTASNSGVQYWWRQRARQKVGQKISVIITNTFVFKRKRESNCQNELFLNIIKSKWLPIKRVCFDYWDFLTNFLTYFLTTIIWRRTKLQLINPHCYVSGLDLAQDFFFLLFGVNKVLWVL